MNNYRIIVEPITDKGREDFKEELREGVECEAFALIADKGKSAEIALMNLGLVEFAKCISISDQIMAAAHIAHAIREGERMAKRQSIISDILSKLDE